MKLAQNGIAANFGLVGKSVRRYLATTALTATGLMAIASPALADNWTDHVASEGSISIDTTTPNTTNITQHTDFTKVHGDGDINAGWTVNVAQPSSSSKYVLYDTEADPTKIMGNLNANGKIYIFDRDGVIFGRDSVVNVGSIIASTKYIDDETIKNGGTVEFKPFADNGRAEGGVVNEGSITVAEGGLAAFVAPNVVNDGVINAKMGTFVAASGEKVTLDLYGDNLVEVAVEGQLSNALIENKGTIKAEGGNVVLTAAAAKDAVDNVINMEGVIDVSSVSTKGGKIVLSGGNSGTVKVSGSLKADGKTGGGAIDVTGDNINVADTALLSADATHTGNGGTIKVIAQDHADFRGSVFARGGAGAGNGGFVEISGYGALGFSGYTDLSATNGTMGTVLLDPTFAIIHSGLMHEPLGLGYVLSAQALANSMKNSNYIVQADEYIDVGTKPGSYNTGNAIIDAILNALPDGNIDLSTYAIPFVNVVPYFPFIIAGVDTGTTAGSITFDSDTVNFNRNLTMGNGNVTVDANTVNLNAILKAKDGSTLGDTRISSNANTVNVLSNAAKIQQGVWLADDAGGATVNVAAGTYNETVNIGKAVTLIGGGVAIVDPNSPAFVVTGNDVTIDGFNIVNTSGADGYGVFVNGAANTTIKNNVINNTSAQGIYAKDATGLKITNNTIDKTTDDAILVDTTASDTVITDNKIGTLEGVKGNGIHIINAKGGVVQRNTITNAKENKYDHGHGIYLSNTQNVLVGGFTILDANIITGSGLDGIKVFAGENNSLYYNSIADSGREGIYGEGTNKLYVIGNTVKNSGLVPGNFAGVRVKNSKNIYVTSNTISDSEYGVRFDSNVLGDENYIWGNTISHTYQDGITVDAAQNVIIEANKVTDTGHNGIQLTNSTGTLKIFNNEIGEDETEIHGNGIYLDNIDGAVIESNRIKHVTVNEHDSGHGIYLHHSDNIMVGGYFSTAQGNTIANVGKDGIKDEGGTNNHLYYNTITDAGREGIFAQGTSGVTIVGNTITNFGIYFPAEKFAGVEVKGGDHAYVVSNNISDGGYGVRMRNVAGTDNYIWGNKVRNVTEDGIYSESTDYLVVEKNDVADTGGNGIYLNGSNGYLNVLSNVVSTTGKNGIKLGEFEDADVTGNRVDLAGYDGIHIEYFNNAFVGGTNVISRSGDDGIEAHNGHWVEIDGNVISESGYGTIVPEEPGEYDGYDEFNGGSDGVSVRSIGGQYVYGDDEGDDEVVYKKVVGYYEDGSVRITNNQIAISGDDGIDVDGVEGYVYVAKNTVSNSGTDGETVYGDYDEFGADGIHIQNVSQGYGDYSGDIREGDIGNGEYNIVVSGNTISTSLDDGIEILGYTDYDYGYDDRVSIAYEGEGYYYGDTGRVLVGGFGEGEANIITNSGYGNPGDGYGYGQDGDYNYYNNGDGIHVANVYADGYASAGSIGDGEFSGYAVDVLGNTVTNSGDDGIEVINSSSTLIDDNTVKNSGYVITGEGTYAGDYYGADGIHVRNVGGYAGDVYYERATGGEGYAYTPYSVVIRENDVDQSFDDGIQVENNRWDMEYSNSILVDSNENVSNSGNHGLYISGAYHPNEEYGYGRVIVTRNNFSNFAIGAEFESGLIDFTGVTLGAPSGTNMGNTFTVPAGSTDRIGLRFSPYYGGGIPAFAKIAEGEGEYYYSYLNLVDDDGLGSTPYPTTPTNFGGTIGSQTFTGFTGARNFYVYLNDGAFTNDGTPIWLNGLNSTYDGIAPSSTGGVLTQAQFDFLENRFQHYPDNSSTDIFWFGFVPEAQPAIAQEDLFNTYDPFNGDLTGLNVRIVGLPRLPGQTFTPQSTASILNQIQTYAGGDSNTPESLNNIETAAGGSSTTGSLTPNASQAQDLAQIETEAGGNDTQACWGDAINAAAGGQSVNVVYSGSFDANLNQAAQCGTSF
ncbi:MAG: hypothetical protein DI551_00185 [Micavibrio aeruginosavorus]|uniref:Right handed beta helix domain-containing protein n=1 Tax=Micavibrio aeruginosavorus TaxID=349221 RepID=A0A2W5NEB9_9BACT|nr:MAG: hypothetical protein DI551_00185 [Micavibrio aeruginosavorus]